MLNDILDISVIIPAYNAEKYVAKAVESTLQFPVVKEVLLIEDGSPDNTLAVCRQLTQRDNRVKLLQHPDQGNHGAGASRNIGLANASCPFIAFLDADDFYLPNRFDVDTMVFAENSEADGVYNALGVHYYSQDAEAAFKKIFLSELTTVTKQVDSKTLFESFIYLDEGCGYFSLDGLTIKKEILEKMECWFNPALRLHQDTEFLIRLAYTAQLFSGEIEIPTARRGVHNENRIIQVHSDDKTRSLYQEKMWMSLYDWAETQRIPDQYREQIYRIMLIKRLLQYNQLHRFFLFITYVVKDKRFFWNIGCYTLAHTLLFGKNKISQLLLRIKNKFQRVLKLG